MRRSVYTLPPTPYTLLLGALMLAAAPLPARAQSVTAYTQLQWRSIGPVRGGRTVAAVGVPQRPGLFYIGVTDGGVWKTNDYGRTWRPIFDSEPTGSVGAIAVAASDPNVIYVGSGEGLQRPDLSIGDGIYKSTDAGRTWVHEGLTNGQQITQITVDPRDPARVCVAVLGHPYGSNPERGVFRSTDGGATWAKVLYTDDETGATDLVLDPAGADTAFAVMWAARQSPWEGGPYYLNLAEKNGLYRSTDGGATWAKFGTGLPTGSDGLGRLGLGTSASEPRRMYAIAPATKNGGLYRSDDGGATWRLVNADQRLWDRDGDFSEVKVDPKNADVVYVVNVTSWKSTDAGAHFTAFKGAPGGDDPHRLWIDPNNTQVMILAGDQGAGVSVNGGETWSSWYNQPTGQFYHVITDNGFPYRVYGGQQESGSAWVLSRGNDGQITFADWHPVGAEEYGYIAPDPLHPNLIFGGKVSRFDLNTGDVKNVAPIAPEGQRYRFVRTEPLLFSPVDPRILYYAGNVVFKTTDGGESWQVISPDLTRDSAATPGLLGDFASQDPEHGRHRGVVYTLAPSYRNKDLIWAGTDDGLIWVTRDGGKKWDNVTPADLTPWSKVSLMEASHVNPEEAYAAVNRFRLDDLKPHIYRTRDGGQNWEQIVAGIPDDEVVNAVREDPARPGLLFAATENQVYVSLDDGDHWQGLRLNMPATSVRDVWIHESDLIAGTHGRGFWILDDIAPLRELAVAGHATPDTLHPTPSSSGGLWPEPHLYAPALATRVRRDKWTDTPLPWDEPAGKNPPDGAIIDYWLPQGVTGPVRLRILDDASDIVRTFSSDDPVVLPDSTTNLPLGWARPPQRFSAEPGPHRFLWDLRYAPPPATERGFPISAIWGDTPLEPLGVWVMPGTYRLQLTVQGRTYEQTLLVRMDPRVKTPEADLGQQFAASMRIVELWRRDSTAIGDVRAMRAEVDSLKKAAGAGPRADSLTAFDAKLAALLSGGGAGGRRGGAPAAAAPSGIQGGQGNPPGGFGGGQRGRGGEGRERGEAGRAQEAGGFAGGQAGPVQESNLLRLAGELGGLYGIVEGNDSAPTSQAAMQFFSLQRSLQDALGRWDALRQEGAGLGVVGR
ncbi:MAG: glycoside hydrolase [Gemmatimonadales bacterium]